MRKTDDLCSELQRLPNAVAFVKGSEQYPNIYGGIMFYSIKNGVMVRAEISGLPKGDGECDNPIYAFHIHSGTECTGNRTDPFAAAGSHYNPNECPHPYHAGDMPPLFTVEGRAFLIFITDRFTLPEILGKSVIIHSKPDDFKTQPSGNAGEKIACGIITPTAR